MSEFQEYPIVTKTVICRDKPYKFDVFRMYTNQPEKNDTWQVVSAANYAVGKELRIAVRDTTKYQFEGEAFERIYKDMEKFKVEMIIASDESLWPTLRGSLDVRVLRYRCEGDRLGWKSKQTMIADMLYLFMQQPGEPNIPFAFKMDGLVYGYSSKRPEALTHPDLFTFDTNSPIIA